MLSRCLNILVIFLISINIFDTNDMANLTYLLTCGLFISCLLTPKMMANIAKKGIIHKGMIPIAELEPASYHYGQRVLCARLLSLSLFIYFISSLNFLMLGLVFFEYILLEYYIYQIRIFNTICLDIFEKKFG